MGDNIAASSFFFFFIIFFFFFLHWILFVIQMMLVPLLGLEIYWIAFVSIDYPVRFIDVFLFIYFLVSSKKSCICVFSWFSGYFSSSPIVGWEIPDVFCFHWFILPCHQKLQSSFSAAFIPSVVLTGSFFNSPCSWKRFS